MERFAMGVKSGANLVTIGLPDGFSAAVTDLQPTVAQP